MKPCCEKALAGYRKMARQTALEDSERIKALEEENRQLLHNANVADNAVRCCVEEKKKLCEVNEAESDTRERYLVALEKIADSQPYPTDIFPEVSKPELKLIATYCRQRLGFPIDRLSAHIGRLVYNGVRKIAKEAMEASSGVPIFGVPARLYECSRRESR